MAGWRRRRDGISPGDVARATGVPVRTLADWDARGLLSAQRPAEGKGQRRYSAEDLYRVRLLRAMRDEHIALAKAARVLSRLASGEPPEVAPQDRPGAAIAAAPDP